MFKSIMIININKINNDWSKFLKKEFSKKYIIKLNKFLSKEDLITTVYPNKKNIFRALNLTSFSETKVVIIGQDPYHNNGQANGLSFAVNDREKIPPSLRNIFKELSDNYPHKNEFDSSLESWAQQGVLLLNSVLTVREKKAGSHQNMGWEELTSFIIKSLSDNKSNIIFLLWGKHALDKQSLINEKKHHILKAPHPSPLSAYRGFFGCKHFLKVNYILKNLNHNQIKW